MNTVFSALLAGINKAVDYNRDDVVRPVAILWPDEKREWERVVPRLRQALPHFLIYGSYDPENRTGPAIWLRCLLAGKIAQFQFSPDIVPVIYLPGVGRATLRATDECPHELKPLAELQYRGVFWNQQNGKDWTVAAFLQTNHGGLQLKVPRDFATGTSLRRAIDHLMDVDVQTLRQKVNAGELNSAYFDSLISEDFVDDLLMWLSDTKGTRSRWDDARWETLCSRCLADYGFDPAKDGHLVGAEMLGLQERPSWKAVWKRFAAMPHRYPGLRDVLEKAKPTDRVQELSFRCESWPQDNASMEDDLRHGLNSLVGMTIQEARGALENLCRDHLYRRDWVWAALGEAPLSKALEHLQFVVKGTMEPLSAGSSDDLARVYVEYGWSVDNAVLDALASVVKSEDIAVVGEALSKFYAPWLRDSAELLQDHCLKKPFSPAPVGGKGEIAKGTCILFVDGLRFDIGQRLRKILDDKVGEVDFGYHWSALPSVTPTAKPAVSPVAGYISGSVAGAEFRPVVAETGKDLTVDRFRALLEQSNIQYLPANEIGDSSGIAWTEFGNLDSLGHQEGIGLSRRIGEMLAHVANRVRSLLDAGWNEIRIVTDHGWLLLTGGLPKVELPKYLTESRWGRCAVVKQTTDVDLPCFPWTWNDGVRVACPSGIGSFVAGQQYNHGGISLQECVVPQITVRSGSTPIVSASVEEIKWAGLRVRVKVSGNFAKCSVDLRDKAADKTSSLCVAKVVGKDGSVALVVEDDSREGSATTLVLLDGDGNVIEKKLVTVGG